MMIQFTTDYNDKEIRKLVLRTQLQNTKQILTLQVIVVLLSIPLAFLVLWTPWSLPRYLPLVLLVAALPLLKKAEFALRLRSRHRELYGADGVVRYTVDETGVHSQTSTYELHRKWSCFPKWETQGELCWLTDPDGDLVVFRKSQFSDQEYQQLKALLDRYIGGYCPEKSQADTGRKIRVCIDYRDPKMQTLFTEYSYRSSGLPKLLLLPQIGLAMLAVRQLYLAVSVFLSCSAFQYGRMLLSPYFYLPALLALAAVVLAAAATPLVKHRLRRGARKNLAEAGTVTYIFSDTCIESHNFQRSSILKWSDVVDFTAMENRLYLKFRTNTGIAADLSQLIQEDREALIAMIRDHAGKPEPEQTEPVPGEHAEPGGEREEAPSQSEFSADFRDYELQNFMVKQAMKRPLSRILRMILYPVLVIVCGYCLKQVVAAPELDWFHTILMLTGITAMIHLRSFFEDFYRKRLNREPKMKPVRYLLSEEGLSVPENAGNVVYPWSQFQDWGMEGNILYLRNRDNTYVYCDRKKLSLTAFEDLKATVSAHVKKA